MTKETPNAYALRELLEGVVGRALEPGSTVESVLDEQRERYGLCQACGVREGSKHAWDCPAYGQREGHIVHKDDCKKWPGWPLLTPPPIRGSLRDAAGLRS